MMSIHERMQQLERTNPSSPDKVEERLLGPDSGRRGTSSPKQHTSSHRRESGVPQNNLAPSMQEHAENANDMHSMSPLDQLEDKLMQTGFVASSSGEETRADTQGQSDFHKDIATAALRFQAQADKSALGQSESNHVPQHSSTTEPPGTEKHAEGAPPRDTDSPPLPPPPRWFASLALPDDGVSLDKWINALRNQSDSTTMVDGVPLETWIHAARAAENAASADARLRSRGAAKVASQEPRAEQESNDARHTLAHGQGSGHTRVDVDAPRRAGDSDAAVSRDGANRAEKTGMSMFTKADSDAAAGSFSAAKPRQQGERPHVYVPPLPVGSLQPKDPPSDYIEMHALARSYGLAPEVTDDDGTRVVPQQGQRQKVLSTRHPHKTRSDVHVLRVAVDGGLMRENWGDDDELRDHAGGGYTVMAYLERPKDLHTAHHVDENIPLPHQMHRGVREKQVVAQRHDATAGAPHNLQPPHHGYTNLDEAVERVSPTMSADDVEIVHEGHVRSSHVVPLRTAEQQQHTFVSSGNESAGQTGGLRYSSPATKSQGANSHVHETYMQARAPHFLGREKQHTAVSPLRVVIQPLHAHDHRAGVSMSPASGPGTGWVTSELVEQFDHGSHADTNNTSTSMNNQSNASTDESMSTSHYVTRIGSLEKHTADLESQLSLKEQRISSLVLRLEDRANVLDERDAEIASLKDQLTQSQTDAEQLANTVTMMEQRRDAHAEIIPEDLARVVAELVRTQGELAQLKEQLVHTEEQLVQSRKTNNDKAEKTLDSEEQMRAYNEKVSKLEMRVDQVKMHVSN